MIQNAWRHYAREHPPSPGYSYEAKRVFVSGYYRGRAAVLGFAILYCTFATFMAFIAVLIAVLTS